MKNKIIRRIGICLLSIILLLFFGVIVLFVYIRSSESTVDLLVGDERNKHQFVIPLEIEDSTYYFLWDTGYGTSVIDKQFFSGLNSRNKVDSLFLSIERVDDVVEKIFPKSELKCKLGNSKIDISFIIDNSLMSTVKRPYVKGIIGQNVISCYNWLFDLQNAKVTFSRKIKQIPINHQVDDTVLILPYSIFKGIPFVDLNLNGLNSNSFAFDTGFECWGNISYQLFPSLIINDETTIDSLLCEDKNLMQLKDSFTDEVKIILCKNIYLNDFPLKNVSIFNRKSYKERNYITANFIFQFEKMYYDSKNKEIKLINYRGDSHPTGDEKKIIQDYFSEKETTLL